MRRKNLNGCWIHAMQKYCLQPIGESFQLMDILYIKIEHIKTQYQKIAQALGDYIFDILQLIEI